MQKEMNVHEYIRPLIAYENDSPGYYPKGRFAGSCFFIDEKGTAITCAHIIEKLAENEELFTFDVKTRKNQKVSIVHVHQDDDFAVIYIPTTGNRHLTIRHDRVILGMHVMSYGFLNGGSMEDTIKVDYRVMKGHVSRLDTNPLGHRSTQVVETSFPSLAGFSGAPIFCENSLDLVGMLFGNIESSVEVFSFKDVNDDGKEIFKESVNRIVELGLAHTSDAIVGYLENFKQNAQNV